MTKWLKRIAAAIGGLVVCFFVLVQLYGHWSVWNTARTYRAPGQVIEVDGAAIHLYCTGQGTPTVVLEAGMDLVGSLGWAGVQVAVAQHTRVCSYDRAGILWSARGERPRDAERIAEELHEALGAALESPPYVMVGHSLGGPYVRVFTERFRNEVVGIVLVDSSHPEQDDRLPPEFGPSIPPTSVLLFGRIFPALTRLVYSPHSGLAEEAREVVLGFLPRSAVGVHDQLRSRAKILEQALGTGPFGDVPLLVLTRGLPKWEGEALGDPSTEWLELQAELLTLSTNAEQRVIEGAGHYIHRQAPEAVIDAILDVLATSRNGASLPKGR